MKNINSKLIILLFIALTAPHLATSQDDLAFELSYEVNRIYPSFSITKEKLKEAHTIADLNRYYKPSWVSTYISVEILASHEGKTRKAMSKQDSLSQEQKDLMYKADVGAGISVRVQYMPENTLKHNEMKEIDFTFTVEPESQATYPGGQQQLKQYLKENVMGRISDAVFRIYNLTAIKFTIDEVGQVVDAHVFETSKDEKTDELLLAAICNMPNWMPAEYTNGTTVKQEFVLTVGDDRSCVINLLNIRKNRLE